MQQNLSFRRGHKCPPGTARLQPAGRYLTREALALGLALFELTLTGQRSDGEPVDLLVYVPNPFTYLLMKLHAFRNRKDDPDKRLASHHALDVYRIVSMLTRDEYDWRGG